MERLTGVIRSMARASAAYGQEGSASHGAAMTAEPSVRTLTYHKWGGPAFHALVGTLSAYGAAVMCERRGASLGRTAPQ